MNENKKVKVVCVGIGGYASVYWKALFSSTADNFEIVGAVDPYAEAAKDFEEIKRRGIPVYADMPSAASPLPAQSTKLNNYYFSNISATGLTPSFNMFTYEYNLYVAGNVTINVTPVKGASYAGAKSYSLKKGDNSNNSKPDNKKENTVNNVINNSGPMEQKSNRNEGENK
jgi:hypothetical protein